MKRGLLVAALPGELGPLVRGWRRGPGPGADRGARVWTARNEDARLAAACAGAGPDAAMRAFAAAEALLDGTPDWVASLGWAGALGAGFDAGKAWPVAEVLDAATGERFPALPLPVPGRGSDSRAGARLLSVGRVAGREEKRRLRLEHGADLVDMEAAAVARLARGRGLPFYCVKGVSDGPDAALPDFNAFLGPDGRFRGARFAAHAALRPALWPGLARLGLDSGRAAQDMARLVAPLLA